MVLGKWKYMQYAQKFWEKGSTKGYQRQHHHSGIVPHLCIPLAGGPHSSSACFPSYERAQEEVSLLTIFYLRGLKSITCHVCCQDSQKAIELYKEIEKGNGRSVSLFVVARAVHEARLSCWRISLRTGLMLGGRHSLLVFCQSTSEMLPSATRLPLDKWFSEVQNYKFELDLSDLLLISTNRLMLPSWPLGTVSELIQTLV